MSQHCGTVGPVTKSWIWMWSLTVYSLHLISIATIDILGIQRFVVPSEGGTNF